MSVINRMLADLERRGAARPQSGDERMTAVAPSPRRRMPSTRLWMGLFAVVLVALAAVLWIQRGERIMAAWHSEPQAAARAPELVGVSFDGSGDRSSLTLKVSGGMARAPRYSRSGGTATLLVDALTEDLVVPAPPRDQAVFHGLSFEPGAGQRTRIQVEVASTAQLDLQVDKGRITLAGRMPVTDGVDREVPSDDPVTSGATSGTPTTSGEDNTDEAVTTAAAGDTSSVGASATTQEGGAGSEATGGDEADAAVAATDTAEATRSAGEDDTGSVDTVAPDGQEPAAAGTAEEAAGEPQPVAGESGNPEASESVRKTRSASPELQARRRYREARVAWGNGELASARRLLVEALGFDPGLHPARDLLVTLMRRAGDMQTARRWLAEGVELAPARVEFAMPYARLLVDAGKLRRAADVLDGARVHGVGTSGYHALVAAVAQRRGLHREAAAEYTRALEIQPGAGVWWLGLGISLVAIEKPDEARAAFREARASGTLSESLDRWAQGRIDDLSGRGEG